MYSLNRATIIGNITRDPEMRTTPNGQNVTSFSVATNRRWKSPTGEFQESTDYHDVVAWGKTAEFIANFMKKGNKIYIDGRLQTRSWETPDGVKQRRTEIVLENFVPLTPKGGSDNSSFDSMDDLSGSASDQADQSAPAPKKPAKPAAEDEINLEDIPF